MEHWREQALGKRAIRFPHPTSAPRESELLGTISVFAPNPNFFGASLVTNEGTSDYHALQLQFNRRLSRGLQALASIHGHTRLITGSAGSSAVVSNVLVPTAKANRGPSAFDIRHSFSAG